MKVWRVRAAHKDHGPFESYDFADKFNDPYRFPTPSMEGLPLSGRVCACRTLTQLRHWFGHKWVVDTLGDAFRIYVMHVPSWAVAFGRAQVTVDVSAQSVLEGVWSMANILRPLHMWGPSLTE